jgi:hypothetical protein
MASRPPRLAVPVARSSQALLDAYTRFQSVSRYVLTNQKVLDVVQAADVVANTLGRALVMVVYPHPGLELTFTTELPGSISGLEGARLRRPGAHEGQLHLVYTQDGNKVENACYTVDLLTGMSEDSLGIAAALQQAVAGMDSFSVSVEQSGAWSVRE